MLGAFFDLKDFGNCGPSGHGHFRGRWGFDGFMGDFWGAGGSKGRGAWRARAGRVFEQGDLKYVILRLLAEKPRHGYEIIKELEDRFSGAYAPSPGTVYPTLTMLEDLGYARAMPEEGGRKIYEITDEGRKHLEEHSATVDDIFERIAKFVEGFFDAPMADLKRSMASLGRATFYVASRSPNDRERLAKISEILKKAATDIEKLTQEESTSGKSEGPTQL
ncbi:MAG TPA: helix-turn-helix transcriptional regulator [Gemmatimonadaceae bacterium]|nr:helix-turn-helix transcriptional regulator [Gemmatimonadaceae bacterium]